MLEEAKIDEYHHGLLIAAGRISTYCWLNWFKVVYSGSASMHTPIIAR